MSNARFDPVVDLRANHRLAWLALVFGAKRAHAGNDGYGDSIGQTYEYDSLVQNHKQVRSKDLMLLAGSEGLLGLARIASIDERQGTKLLLRCPLCRTSGLKRRTRVEPEFRCRNGHEFDEAVQDQVSCTMFTAVLETFVPSHRDVTLDELRHGRVDGGHEMALGAVDLELVRQLLRSKVPNARELLADADGEMGDPAVPGREGRVRLASVARQTQTESADEDKEESMKGKSEHRVLVSTPRLEIGYAQFLFRVKKGNRLIGELGVSQGGLEWWGRYKRGKGKHISWSSLDKLVGEASRGRRARD